MMNWEQVQLNWEIFRRKALNRWGKLVYDLDRIDGDRDQLIIALQEQYGITRKEAEEEVDEWVTHLSELGKIYVIVTPVEIRRRTTRGSFTIFDVSIQSAVDAWEESFPTSALAEAFLRGVMAGSFMNGGVRILTPGVSESRETIKETETVKETTPHDQGD